MHVNQEAKKARLRRICEMKPSGKCHVPREVHEAWLRGGTSRTELEEQFAKCKFKKVGLHGLMEPVPI